MDNFHSLLFLESEVPGGPGEMAHFYAVASYGLQHPGSMGYTEQTVAGLRSEVEAVLSGTSGMEEVRRRVRKRAGGAGRVTRREGDVEPRWSVSDWPVTVADVLEGGTGEYRLKVEEWARSIVTVLGTENSP